MQTFTAYLPYCCAVERTNSGRASKLDKKAAAAEAAAAAAAAAAEAAKVERAEQQGGAKAVLKFTNPVKVSGVGRECFGNPCQGACI